MFSAADISFRGNARTSTPRSRSRRRRRAPLWRARRRLAPRAPPPAPPATRPSPRARVRRASRAATTRTRRAATSTRAPARRARRLLASGRARRLASRSSPRAPSRRARARSRVARARSRGRRRRRGRRRHRRGRAARVEARVCVVSYRYKSSTPRPARRAVVLRTTKNEIAARRRGATVPAAAPRVAARASTRSLASTVFPRDARSAPLALARANSTASSALSSRDAASSAARASRSVAHGSGDHGPSYVASRVAAPRASALAGSGVWDLDLTPLDDDGDAPRRRADARAGERGADDDARAFRRMSSSDRDEVAHEAVHGGARARICGGRRRDLGAFSRAVSRRGGMKS